MRKLLSLFLCFILLTSCSSVKEITEVQLIENTEVIKEDDDELLVGEEKVVQKSEPKEIEQTIRITTGFFNKEKREVVKEETLSEGKPTIKKVGVKEVKTIVEEVFGEEVEVIYEEDPSLEYLEEVVVQEGNKRVYESTFEETYIKGKLIERKEIQTEIIKEATPKIIRTNTNSPVINYDNTDLSWWFQPSGSYGVKPTIPSHIADLIEPFNVRWLVPTDEKIVYLTFDQGYEYNDNTSLILDTLREKNVLVTFFVTGSYVDHNNGVINRMINEGHQIANHSINHYRAAPTINDSVDKFVQDIKGLEEKLPSMVKLHRPPEGGYSQQSLALLKGMGYTTVFWSFAYRDWLTDDQPSTMDAFNKLTDSLHPGAIYLLHSVSDTNVMILGDFIDYAQRQGYRFELVKPMN